MHPTKIPCCQHHYGRGARDIRIFRGPTYNQAGAGFFGDVFRNLVPILKEKVMPYVGRRLKETGQEFVEDMKQGSSLGAALKKGAKRTFQLGKQDVIRKLTGQGYKRVSKKKSRSHKKRTVKKTIRRRDFFNH